MKQDTNISEHITYAEATASNKAKQLGISNTPNEKELQAMKLLAEKVFKPTYATFNADGTYSGRGALGAGKGTYKAQGKTITCYVEGKEFLKYDVLSLSGKECELKVYQTGSSSSVRIRCKKQ